jgi:hypothetical protein
MIDKSRFPGILTAFKADQRRFATVTAGRKTRGSKQFEILFFLRLNQPPPHLDTGSNVGEQVADIVNTADIDPRSD